MLFLYSNKIFLYLINIKTMAKINSNELLPQELVIDSVDNHLYRIGLCLQNNNTNKKRNFIYKPIVVLIVILFHFIKFIINMFITQRKWFIYLGVLYTRISNMKVHFNVFSLLVLCFLICIIIIWFHNYKNDIKPTFLKVFQMMSGFITPVSIGLTNHNQIIDLIKRTRILFRITSINATIIIPLAAIIFSIVPFILSCSIFETIVF